MANYYGFVYRWYDKKHNMYYIGSHHGLTNSKYVCSSKIMLRAYKKRPKDFTREILEFNIKSNDPIVTKMLEQRWLDLIPDIKSNPLYYNLKNEAEGGWSFIQSNHINKRAQTLKEKHKAYGLSKKEKTSYSKKIDTRLERIADTGFTEKEINQHNSYGYTIKVVLPTGEERVYPSMAKASKELQLNCQYARIVTSNGKIYKGHQVYILREPLIDCRGINK